MRQAGTAEKLMYALARAPVFLDLGATDGARLALPGGRFGAAAAKLYTCPY